MPQMDTEAAARKIPVFHKCAHISLSRKTERGWLTPNEVETWRPPKPHYRST